MIVGIFGGTFFNKVVMKSTTQTADFWLRIISIVIMVIALAVISKQALEEWRTSKTESKDSSTTDSRVSMGIFVADGDDLQMRASEEQYALPNAGRSSLLWSDNNRNNVMAQS